MQIAGASFIIGAVFQASTCCSEGHRFLLFIGRIFWGIGVGFGDHSVSRLAFSSSLLYSFTLSKQRSLRMMTVTLANIINAR